ncbi:hypothetical protein [Amaricoccus sp.]|uniref:hypothetical protein n=1 Tax=Amaricoccus sp. TaxID=1872485 RepID=UPI001B4A74CA|nr:hypothetical protein [Amaricoccus sp.]MBP7241447.1 hypothetical protein [Amaricoccus sp.]
MPRNLIALLLLVFCCLSSRASASCEAISPGLFDKLRATATTIQAAADLPPMTPFDLPVTVSLVGRHGSEVGYYAFARRTDLADAPIEPATIGSVVASSDGARTEVTLRVSPPAGQSFLRQATYQILVLACRASPGGRTGPLTLDAGGAPPPELVAFVGAERTFSTWFSGIVWALAILALGALLMILWARHLGQSSGGFGRGLKLLFADFSGRVSLARFQLFVFFAAVLGTVAYVFGRTRELSDLSQDVLLLLGITAVSTTAATIGDVNKNRLTWSNWVWLTKQGAFPDARTSKLSWFQLVSTSGGFDMYRFQALMFTLLVAPTFVIMSVYALGEARIPQGILAVLGLSQATYIVGKVFGPPTIAEFDKQITDYRKKLEDGTAKAADREELMAAFATALDEAWDNPALLATPPPPST